MAVDFEELTRGVCVIIDDDINKPGNSARSLYQDLQRNGIPVIAYETIPNDENTLESFQNVSYMILDWQFQKISNIPDEVSLGAELVKDTRDTILSFLQKIKAEYFIPIFLLTGQNFEDVKEKLIEANVYSEDVPDIIMLESKDAISDYNSLKDKVQAWLQRTPSALVLKIWEREASRAKHKMFLDLYKASPEWVSVILQCIKTDNNNNERSSNQEFQDLLNNNFINRMADGEYCNIELKNYETIKPDEIRKVLEGERFISYKESIPDISYVGDLYKSNEKEEYYLNIRAQCDLSRESNPVLYLITGTVPTKDVALKKQKIRLMRKKNNAQGEFTYVLSINQEEYPLDEIIKFDPKQIKEFNSKLKPSNDITFSLGELIPKRIEEYIACIADQKIIHFEFCTFKTRKKDELERESIRIGRLIPPYITKIQQECAAYLIRTGIMPLPPQLFKDDWKPSQI